MSQLSIVKNNIVQTISDEQLNDLAIMAFEDHVSDEAIAKHFGMSKPTYYKLKKTPRFQNALKSYGDIAVRKASNKIQANADRAVQTLIDLMTSDAPQIRLKASIEVLRLAGIGLPLPELTNEQSNNQDKALLLQYLQSMSPPASKVGTTIELSSDA